MEDDSPFDSVLRETNLRLAAAHSAALGTMEAELQRMRAENTMLRMRLAEAGLNVDSKLGHGGSITAQTHASHMLSSCSSIAHAVEAATSTTAIAAPTINAASASMASLQTASDAPAADFIPAASANRRVQPAREVVVVQTASETGAVDATAAGSVSWRVQPHKDIVEEASPASVDSSGSSSSTGPEAMQATPDLDSALKEVLAYYGLHNLEVQRLTNSSWAVAGVSFMLRFQAPNVVSQPSAGNGPPFHLLASTDGGRSWGSLETLIRQHVQRTQPELPAPSRLADLARRPVQRGQTHPRVIHLSSEEYGKAENASAPIGHEQQDTLPVWRSDGMPSFNDAFPAAFSAHSGSSHYYNQFRVRVPPSSQYEQ